MTNVPFLIAYLPPITVSSAAVTPRAGAVGPRRRLSRITARHPFLVNLGVESIMDTLTKEIGELAYVLDSHRAVTELRVNLFAELA